MGLLTPVELVEVGELGPVHFIAIGGSGMNGVASALLQAPMDLEQQIEQLFARQLSGDDGRGS